MQAGGRAHHIRAGRMVPPPLLPFPIPLALLYRGGCHHIRAGRMVSQLRNDRFPERIRIPCAPRPPRPCRVSASGREAGRGRRAAGGRSRPGFGFGARRQGGRCAVGWGFRAEGDCFVRV